MATIKPVNVRPPRLPVGLTATGPQFPLSTGYYWIGEATASPHDRRMGGIVIYNDDECYFLYAQDALSVLYFLRSLEEKLLQQTQLALHPDTNALQPDTDAHR
jgi:hypothetical protein